MPLKDTSPSLLDFSLIKTHVDKITQDQDLRKTSLGFVFFALDLILGLQGCDRSTPMRYAACCSH
jgi:hypothetical protein